MTCVCAEDDVFVSRMTCMCVPLTYRGFDRIHMSAYVSGGKRRITKADESHAFCIRKCHAILVAGDGNPSHDV